MDAHSNNRHRIVAALSVLNDGEGAAKLATFMSQGDGDIHASLVKEYTGGGDVEYQMRRTIKQIVSSDKFSSLFEVHPAWILEHLRYEQPRIIGIILRFLPSQHVRYILKNLPPMLCEQVPNMVESFSVSPDVLKVIQRKFEGHFLPMRISRSIDRPGFENLYYLKEQELEALFIELGLMELAIALSTMSSKVLRVIYNRLDIKDAKRLQAKINALPSDLSLLLLRHARSSLLHIELERVGPKQLLKIIGLGAFADAMGKDHDDLVRMIQQRLDPRDGYLLKRYVDERRVRPSAVSQEERQGMILDVVALLAREGRIDGAWSGLSSDEGFKAEAGESASAESWDEETSTLHQLA